MFFLQCLLFFNLEVLNRQSHYFMNKTDRFAENSQTPIQMWLDTMGHIHENFKQRAQALVYFAHVERKFSFFLCRKK